MQRDMCHLFLLSLCTTIIIVVMGRNRDTTSKVFKEHLLARKLWTAPDIYLNRVQNQAANLTFTKPFQLIQGPPGN